MFTATLQKGHRNAQAPFGLLEISDEAVIVRTLRTTWRSAPKETIRKVIFYGWPLVWIKFTDSRGELAGVEVLPTRYRRVLREFRERGYPVTDNHGIRLLPPYRLDGDNESEHDA